MYSVEYMILLVWDFFRWLEDFTLWSGTGEGNEGLESPRVVEDGFFGEDR